MNQNQILRLVAITVLCAFSAPAQVNYASITGVVTDSLDAVIPGARVTTLNTGTGIETKVETNEVGYYTVLSLRPGAYEVIVETEGFRQFIQQNVSLETGQQLRLEVRLELGSLTETVTVTAAPPSINLENGAVKGDVIIHEEIQELPLQGRDFSNLAFLIPGVVPSGQGPGRFSVNGSRGDQTNFYVDGVSNRNPVNGGAQVRPPIDAIEEFRVETSGFSAEYGNFSGGILNITMRSGTNQFHGRAFEFIRNEAFDARGFFDQERLKLRRNQFGGTFSGPIVKNKAFFLVSYEGRYQNIGRTRFGRVPTDLERAGDFSDSIDPTFVAGRISPVVLNDPDRSGPCNARIRRGCFPNNIIPLSRQDPVALNLLGFYPSPNNSDIRFNSIATANDADNWHQMVAKIDHRFSDRDNMSVSYQKRFNNLSNPFAGSALALWGNDITDRRELVSINHTHMFSPTFIMEVQGGFSRSDRATETVSRDFDAASIGLKVIDVEERFRGFPRVTVRNMFPLGAANNTPARQDVIDAQASLQFNLVKNKHTYKWGFTFARTYYDQPQWANVRGTYNFRGRFTSHSVGDLLLGRLQNTTRRAGLTENGFRSNSFGFYLNDDWKATRNLTLNLGVRYEIDRPPRDALDRLANYLPSLNKVVLASDRSVPNLDALLEAQGLTDRTVLADDIGFSRRLVDTDFNNFSPRLGFAWRPFGGSKTVIRGGYGMFYQGYLLGPVRQQLGGAFPFTFNETFNSNVNANNPTPPPTLQDPFPTLRSRTNGAGTQNVNGFDPDPPSAYMQNWSFTLERDLGQSQAIEIGYVGTKGTHLQRRYDLNQPIRQLELSTGENNQGRLIFPRPIDDFNRLNYMSFGSNSTYQALQVSLRRRSRSGLFYRLNYTFSKSIDDSSTNQGGGGSGGGAGGALDPTNLRLERGRSNFDRRHVVTASGRYELPFGNGRRYFSNWKGATQAVLGGWQLSTTVTAYSGTPFTVQTSNVDLQAGEYNRPNRVGSGILDEAAIVGRRGMILHGSTWPPLSASPASVRRTTTALSAARASSGSSPSESPTRGATFLTGQADSTRTSACRRSFASRRLSG